MSDANAAPHEAAFHQLLRRIASAVMAAMVQQRLSVQDVAEKSGLPVSYVRRVLTGEAYGLTLRRLVMLELVFDREILFVPTFAPKQHNDAAPEEGAPDV